MLNSSLFMNIIGVAASNYFKAYCSSEVPSLDLAGDRSILNGKSLPISTSDQAKSVLYTGPAFQAYHTQKHSLQPLVKASLVLWIFLSTLFIYRLNPVFVIALWFTLATACTGLSKVSWKCFLHIP